MRNFLLLTKELCKKQSGRTKHYLGGVLGTLIALVAVTFILVSSGNETDKKEGESVLSGGEEIQGIAQVLQQDEKTVQRLPSKLSLSELGQRENVQMGNPYIQQESTNTEAQKHEWKEESSIEESVTETSTKEWTADFDKEAALNVVTEKVTEPAAEAMTEPTTEVITEPATEAVTEPVTEAMTKPEMEAITEPVTEVVTEPVGPQYTYNLVEFNIADSDYYWLIRIVEAEAGNQDSIGKILVANVIFNRVRSSHFANTVESVIFQNDGQTYQFEPVKTGRIYHVTPSQHTIDCVGKAMAGEDYSRGALYFTMRTSPNSWFNRSLNLLFIHGDHYFYSH